MEMGTDLGIFALPEAGRLQEGKGVVGVYRSHRAGRKEECRGVRVLRVIRVFMEQDGSRKADKERSLDEGRNVRTKPGRRTQRLYAPISAFLSHTMHLSQAVGAWTNGYL